LSIKYYAPGLLSIILVVIFVLPLRSQWVNNPSLNTKLVVDGVKPINISSVEDLKGGAFIFWDDNKSGFQNEIFFIHMDGNGKVSFNADGKKISDQTGDKFTPAVAQNLPNTAVVVWKDYSRSKNGNLFAQRVYNNGNLLWQIKGVQVTPDYPDVIDYAVCSDTVGNVYISYIAKSDEFGSSYRLILQKINVNGNLQDNIHGILVDDSFTRKSISNVIADNEGGAFLFWLENQNNKTVLFAQHVDSFGKQLWGKKAIALSNYNQTVLSYSVQKSDFSALYPWFPRLTERRARNMAMARRPAISTAPKNRRARFCARRFHLEAAERLRRYHRRLARNRRWRFAAPLGFRLFCTAEPVFDGTICWLHSIEGLPRSTSPPRSASRMRGRWIDRLQKDSRWSMTRWSICYAMNCA